MRRSSIGRHWATMWYAVRKLVLACGLRRSQGDLPKGGGVMVTLWRKQRESVQWAVWSGVRCRKVSVISFASNLAPPALFLRM